MGALRARAGAALALLLGISAYAAPVAHGPALDDREVEDMRRNFGGQLAPQGRTQTRWYIADLESAQFMADAGDISRAAQLCRAMHGDGVYAGLMATLTSGVVRLPKRFSGRADIVRALEGRRGARRVFDEMFPPAELALLARDGRELGIGVGELVPVEGRDFPVFVRLEPEFLRYRWSENRWYYLSVAGPIAITPGDGRWILHMPGGRVSPWLNGIWRAAGGTWIQKSHASLHLANWEAKLANPARVAYAPQGATEEQKQSWFRKVMAWGVNTVFGLTPGYEVKLLESNGRGYESFGQTIERADKEFAIVVAGQVVTVDGGTGFSNHDVHKSIRADLIQDTADALAYTLNTQGIPPFVIARFGVDALEETALVEWDVTEPKNLASEAATYTAVAGAVTALTEALKPFGRQPDVTAIAQRFGVPIDGDDDGDGEPDELGGSVVEVDVDVEEIDAANDDEEAAA